MAGKRKAVPAAAGDASPSHKGWNDTRGTPKRQRRRLPESATAPRPIDDEMFRWDASRLDHEYTGDWDWMLAPKEARDVLDLLSRMSELTWREIKGMKTSSKRRSRPLHHAQPVEDISADAQQRLDQIGRGDQEEVFRFRHGNMIRVWGVLEGPRFYILWFDRDHKICPVET